MFHRRLLLLALLIALGTALPTVRLVYLTTAQSAVMRERAESRLATRSYIPTQRGRILDRKGRVLAQDRPSYDVAIDYAVITGQWAWTEAARAAREAHRARWTELSPLERERLVEEQLPAFQVSLSEGWRHLARLTGASLDDLEQRKAAIIRPTIITQSIVREAQRSELERLRQEESLARGEELSREVASADINIALPEQHQPHVMVRGVEDAAAFVLLDLAERGGGVDGSIPGLHVVDASRREYPLDRMTVTVDRSHFPSPLRSDQPAVIDVRGVATHVVGWMRSTVYPDDLELRRDDTLGRGPQEALGRPALAPPPPGSPADARPSPDLGFYRQGDRVGTTGIERAGETRLRGLRGTVVRRLDTGETIREPHQPGADVPLTIDAVLQARVQALLDPGVGLTVVQPWHKNQAVVPDPFATSPNPKERFKTIELGTPLAAAAVVIEVDTGDVLVLASSPTFMREDIADQPDKVFDDPVIAAFRNRAIEVAYPPGSIVKPLIYNAAVAAGVIGVDHRIACTGLLYPEQPNHYRCWAFKQFSTTHSEQFGGDLSASDALMVSCNIYFYTLGRTLGPERTVDWYGRLGVGRANNIHPPWLGIGPQFSGVAGDARGPEQTTRDEATLMGMGQGPVAWTPLHAADAYATLARGGVRLPPRVRADLAPTMPIDLGFDPRAVTMALDGLRRSVTDERGTSHHLTVVDALNASRREPIFTAPNVTIWGKSGTADAPAIIGLDDAQRRALLRDGDHSWFVGLCGPTGPGARPKYAIAVVVEFGGSGGRVAGPIANQIVVALQAEGYLGAPPAAPTERPRDADGSQG